MRSSHENRKLNLYLGVLFALTPFSIDLYLSAFREIAADLGTTVARTSLTISVYFIGFALGQILYGPFLDRYGRKPPIYVGLIIYILANIGCAWAPTLEVLLVFRLLSALGGSAATVGALTMVRDFFKGNDVPRALSILMLVLSTSPLLAPTIGSMMLHAWGWRILFGVLIVLAVIDLVIVWRLPVGYLPDPAVRLRVGPILRTFREIFAQPQFRTYALSSSLSFAGLFVYVAGSPNVFMEGFHLSPRQFGLVFAFMAGGMILGSQLNRLLLRRIDGPRLFRRSLTTQAALSLLFVATASTTTCSMATTMAFTFSILICCGITSPNGSALAVLPFHRNVGSASALFSFLELGLGAVVSLFLSVLKIEPILAMSLAIALSSSIAWIILRASTPASNASLGVKIN